MDARSPRAAEASGAIEALVVAAAERLSLATLLATRGHRVTTTPSPRFAAEHVAERSFDLIVVDITETGPRYMTDLERLQRAAADRGSALLAVLSPALHGLARSVAAAGVPFVESDDSAEALRRLLGLVESQARLAVLHRNAAGRLAFIERCLDAVPFGITVTDAEGRIVFANGPEAAMHGYEVDDLIGRDVRMLAPEAPSTRSGRIDLAAMGTWRRKSENRRGDGTTFPVILTSCTVTGEDGTPQAVVTTSEDDTERQTRAELTDPEGRVELRSTLERSLRRIQRNGGDPFALLYLDIDHFRSLNYSLGHHRADTLLVDVLHRLEALATDIVEPPQRAMVSHLGGDEYGIFIEPVATEREAAHMADLIHRGLVDPFDIDDRPVRLTASIGVVVSAPHHTRPEEVLGDGNAAAARAKRRGKACTVVFDRHMREEQIRDTKVEHELNQALIDDQLVLLYQPILDADNGDLRGMEALLRWRRDDGTLTAPDTFIKVAEQSGLIVPIGRWAVDETCRQIRTWQTALRRPLGVTVSVNISGVEFERPDLVTQVDRSLRNHGLYGSSLRLEITESTLMERADQAAAMVKQLRSLGIGLSIDDFGTGYSSLAYLQRFDIDAIKIDRSFVSDMHRDPDSRQIVATIVTLAQALHKTVVAEGVELWAHLEHLRGLGCDAAQGFYFSVPLPPDDMEKLLRNSTPTQVT